MKDAPREIWFRAAKIRHWKDIFDRSLVVSWKGYALIGAFFALVIPTFWISDWATRQLYKIVVLVGCSWIALRHTEYPDDTQL